MADSSIVISTSAIRRVLLAILAVPLIAAVLFVAYQQRERFPAFATNVSANVDANGYQAVFLTSAQVFFGRLTVPNADYYLLTDVYYLNAPPQDGQAGQLLKRGGELHGPRDPMIIPAASVLFIENVKDDSEVMAAIRRFQRGEPQPAPATTPRPSPTR